MPGDASQPETPEAPLPPRPLADTDAEAGDVRSGPLPWATPCLTAVAAGIAGVMWRYWYIGPGLVDAAVRYFVLAGALMGLGACLMDRWAHRWPRAGRWAMGMGVGAGIPVGTTFVVLNASSLRATSWPCPTTPLILPLAFFAVFLCAAVPSSVLGAALGMLATKPRLRWLMPFVGATCLMPLNVGTFVAWGPPSLGLCEMIGGNTTNRLPAYSDPLPSLVAAGMLGALLGLAMLAGVRWSDSRHE